MKGCKNLRLSMSCGSVLAQSSFECICFRVGSDGHDDGSHRAEAYDSDDLGQWYSPS